MDSRVWLIMDCSSGFGEQFARQNIARGDRVIATGRNAATKLAHLRDTGAAILDLDVAIPETDIFSIVKEAHQTYGKIDVLVNNAGYIESGAMEELSCVPSMPMAIEISRSNSECLGWILTQKFSLSHIDGLAAQTDDVEKFLMTIPEAKDVLQSDVHIPYLGCFEVFQAIQQNIASRLDTKNDAEDWLSQLIELELEGEDVPDTASHIARLLTSYVVNRPWVFSPKMIRTKSSHLAPRFHPEITVSPKPGGHKKSILDYKSVVDLLIHGEPATNTSARVISVMSEGSRRDYSERIDKKSEILAESDSILGIAGFYPLHEEPELADDGINRAISTVHTSLKTEWEFIRQFCSHIGLIGLPWQCAAISFAPHYAKDAMDRAKLSVEQAIKSLASQIDALQEKSGHLGQLLFIYLHSSGMHAEVGSIVMEFVEDFIHAYMETKVGFDQYLRDALEKSRPVPTFSQNVTNTATFRLVPRPSPLFDGPFTTGSYLYQLIQHYSLGDRDVRILSPLLEALHPILESIGITQFNPHEGSHAAAIEILHITALAVQSLCLMVQSYLRESVTPMQFEFLTTPIYGFVLQGAIRPLRIKTVLEV